LHRRPALPITAQIAAKTAAVPMTAGETPVVPTAGWMRIMTVFAIISQMMTKTGTVITVPAKAQMPEPDADTTRKEADATIINSGRKGAYMRSEQDARRVIDLYSDMIRRICLLHLKNQADTEDVFQEVFLKYILHCDVFENAEHEKAWFIRVTLNACKDFLKSLFRHRTVPLDLISEETGNVISEYSDILETVLSLPDKYKNVIYLHYYEGYTAKEIGRILNKKENTIYSLLSRGRELLKLELGGDGIE
jgi:RNA polymerase sigma factor (sigma-70 family)